MCICVCDVLSLLQVYKVLVRKTPDESWVVFRRYTDFSRLNDKVCLGVLSVHVFTYCMFARKVWTRPKFQASLKLYFVIILPCLQTQFLTITLCFQHAFFCF